MDTFDEELKDTLQAHARDIPAPLVIHSRIRASIVRRSSRRHFLSVCAAIIASGGVVLTAHC